MEIRLRTTPEGITASVRADNPQAAQTLMLAGDELRRALEAQGLPVLSLDVSDGSRRQAAHDDPGAPARRRAGADAGAAGDDDEPMTSGPVRLPGSGNQIDVLA